MKPNLSSELAEGTDCCKELIKQLRKKWKCLIHSKRSESPIYCYTPRRDNICYPLTIGNIGFWTV